MTATGQKTPQYDFVTRQRVASRCRTGQEHGWKAEMAGVIPLAIFSRHGTIGLSLRTLLFFTSKYDESGININITTLYFIIFLKGQKSVYQFLGSYDCSGNVSR